QIEEQFLLKCQHFLTIPLNHMATHPPLHKTFVIEYDNGNPDFPVLGVRKDPSAAGYREPNEGTPHPDTSRYPNHKFIGTEPTGQDNSILWIYKRVPGPESETRSIGQDSLIPARFRGMVKTVVTSQEVAADTALPATLTGDQTKVEIAEASETIALQRITEEVIDENAAPLIGERTDDQGIVKTEERIVVEGTAAEEGPLIADSRVIPIGGGKAIKTVETYDIPNSSSFPANYFRNEDETSGLVTEGYVQLVPSKLVEPTTYDALVAQYKMQGSKVQTKPNTKDVATLI